MPKKKKTASVSPSRKNLDCEKVVSFSVTNMASPPGAAATSQPLPNKEELFSGLSEMFSDLDPSVVYMVLSESDFKVNNAMDYLLELSTAAKGAVASFSSNFGFDSIAASLDDISQEISTGSKATERKTHAEENLLPPEGLLTAELDSLIENAYETYSLSDSCYHHSLDSVPQFTALDNTRKSCDPPDLIQPSSNALLPVIQSQTDDNVLPFIPSAANPKHTGSFSDPGGTTMQTRASMLADVGVFADELDRSNPAVMVSVHNVISGLGKPGDLEVVSGNSDGTVHIPSNLMGLPSQPWQVDLGRASNETETCEDPSLQKLQRESGRMTASDLQRNMESSIKSPVRADECHSQLEQHTKVSAVPWTNWNPLASEFYPLSGCYSFVTPIAVSPVQWNPASDRFSGMGIPAPHPISSSAWHNGGTFLPKEWGESDGSKRTQFSPVLNLPVVQNVKRKMPLIGKILMLLRGVPGSGKSTLARTLLEQNPSGIILSSDDFFSRDGKYQYDINGLGEAHEWNQQRAKEAFEKMFTPIIIDNTNTQAWEMKPYVAMAMQHKYRVVFREPDTWWKFKPKELERRNTHGVSKEKIKRMLERYERHVTVNTILNSSAPDRLEHICQSQEQEGDGGNISEVEIHLKEGKLSTSSITHHQITEEEKPNQMMGSSPLLQNFLDCSTSDSEQEKKEMKTGSMVTNSENRSTADCVVGVDIASEAASLESHKMKEEEAGRESTEKGSKDDMVAFEYTKNLNVSSVERMGEIHDIRYRENQSEYDQCCEIPTESETVEEKFSLVALQRPELLNFVGDWPIEQSMGQRILKNKRTQKCSTVQYCEENPISSHSLEANKITIEDFQEGLDDPRNIEDKVEGHPKKQEGSNFTSESVPGVEILESAKVKEELVNSLADWPSNTLEQRPQRSRKAHKSSLNEGNMKDRINEHVEICDFPTVDMLQNGSEAHGEMQDNKTSICQDGGVSVSETKEMKCKQNRRACKLALTFMNNPHSTTPIESLYTINIPDINPKQHLCKGTNQYSQTEPEEFALLWRMEKRKASGITESAKVLSGKIDRFKSKDLDVTVNLESQGIIPYRVMHDKSTHVEESELISVDEMENLKVLCKLFRSVSFDVLEDLYERCNKDIAWATNLLLDSGEKLFKEDDCYQGESEDVNVEPVIAELESKPSVNPLETLEQSRYGEDPDDVIQHCERKTICMKHEASGKLYDAAESQPLSTAAQDSEYRNVLHNVEAVYFGLDCVEQPLSLVTLPSTLSDLSVNYVVETVRQPLVTVPDMQSLDEANPYHGFSMASSTLLEEEGSLEMGGGDGSSMDNELIPLWEIHQVTENANPEDIDNFKKNEHTSGLMPVCVGRDEDESSMAPKDEDRAKILSDRPVSPESLDFDCLELSLLPELAFQLSELFGPVGIDPGSLTGEDCVVYIDLHLAQAIHKKWKESIKERQRQEALSYQLILEDWSLSEHSQLDGAEILSSFQKTDGGLLRKKSNWNSQPPAPALAGPCQVFSQQQEFAGLPFMDHWNTQTPKVSLRQIMSEEIAFQEHQDLRRVPIWLKKDCAAKLKEKQLQEMYPNLDQKLLMDIFRDNSYSLEKTQQLLKFVLEADPVRNVIAQETVQQSEPSPSCNAEKTRETTKKMKVEEDILSARDFQDVEHPNYNDFRAEALLHRSRQQGCFHKAAEAYRRGMKGVATFYAQQGHLHGQKLKEANARAAEQIFERLNEPLLPENVLDLHGLHVEEALKHLRHVLKEKTEGSQNPNQECCKLR
ncbi:NEDD4-binding protein 2 isoform X2 [Rhinatrema bivittatum]|uniref:NEDD4-binding protein 2 isoform X2 n=1 Tax=Rhinatrema bivittatum TaxID=194408 RepID=UPI00112C7E88|nr:NEDD4-binding protein 2 isoform X2 [Rhinatrema bivittatum]